MLAAFLACKSLLPSNGMEPGFSFRFGFDVGFIGHRDLSPDVPQVIDTAYRLNARVAS